MTASKRGRDSVIRIERVPKNEVNYKNVYHVGGGPLRGIVINKASSGMKLVSLPPATSVPRKQTRLFFFIMSYIHFQIWR